MLGRSLAHYVLLEELGRGGMGVVYKARDVHLDRVVAIKVLPPEKVTDRERKRRFVQEARAASALNHPHIITIHDIDCAEGHDFIAMEYVEGQTLAQRIPRQGLPIPQALGYACEISDALSAAHRGGIIHRDLKPANIMVTKDEHVKLLDFGLAKLTQPSRPDVSADTKTVASRTAEGTIVGSPAYMSPEQVEGRELDPRSDVFSFGAVLYEMLTGRRAFQGDSGPSTLSAILRDPPPTLASSRRDVPAELARIVQRCLEKDRASRYPSGRELNEHLVACQARLVARELGSPSLLRRPRLVIPVLTLLVALLAASTWLGLRGSREKWALETALPEIGRLADRRDYAAAFRLAQEAHRYIPMNGRLAERWPEISVDLSIETSPPGAEVHYKEYAAADEWIPLGRSPLKSVRVPRGLKRWRIAKQAFGTIDAALAPEADGPALKFTLTEEKSLPSGMVRVPGGSAPILLTGLDHLVPSLLDDFLIDKYEVTNRAFAEFVANGGYRKPEYWRQPFSKGNRSLAWQEAMALFRDSTDRPGPATWELGAYPPGQDEFPVTGVSWYESAAYAEFTGRSLPTLYHWNRAAWNVSGFRDSSPIVLLSNFGGQGPAPVGRHQGMNPHGTYDLAGNVKEWVWNAADAQGASRYILGGAWNEPVYMYNDPDAQDAFSRLPTYGFRCVKYLSGVGASLQGPLDSARRDYERERPVADDVFRIYRSFYRYDQTGLDPEVVSVDSTPQYWRLEKVAFNAGYGNERITAYLFVPRNVAPPYQAVVFFPGSGALRERRAEQRLSQNASTLDFIVRSGRAVLFPVYKSTFERGDGVLNDRPNLTSNYRDHVIQWHKDVARSIDYLATRSDVDAQRLGYHGFSWGATMGPIVLALEERLKAAVLVIGGFWQQRGLPEVEQLNFAPRVKTPVLMLNGRYDFVFPVENSQRPMFRLLGTPEPDKRHLLFDSGHSIPRKELITETLRWFDRYLGPTVR